MTMPITDLQLDLLAEKTRLELEEKIRTKASSTNAQTDEIEVKCVAVIVFKVGVVGLERWQGLVRIKND